MEVEFRTTADDYVAFYRYFFFWRKIGWRILVVGFACFYVTGFSTEDHSSYTWTKLLIALALTLFIIAILSIIPYMRTISKHRKMSVDPEKSARVKLILTENGLTAIREAETAADSVAESWRWAIVDYVDNNDRFVFVVLSSRKVLLIPRSSFHSENEVDNFVGTIRSALARVRGADKEANREADRAQARRIAYWGLMGIAPILGAITGLVLFILGVARYKSWLLIIIGVADILFTAVFIGVLIGLSLNGPEFASLNRQRSQSKLNTVFKSVEFYKIQHGHYPDSLKQVEDIQGNVWITDPLSTSFFASKPFDFYYQNTGDKYWLFSVGEDGKPFTADDIYPMMDPADSAKFGLRLVRP
jgi:VIT1/CCC1 family predicted Fe2+/Mn2+ transporter